jgi:hypothetical protein
MVSVKLWIDNNNWMMEQSRLDNNQTSYTLNYRPNHGYPLIYAVRKIEKPFSIRIILPLEDKPIQSELRAYYQKEMPKEIIKALNSSTNLHNPTLKPLIDNFPSALRETSLYKKLEKNLEDKGYWIDKKIDFEKFTIDKEKYLFYSDIWLEAFPFKKLLKSVKETFPNITEGKLKKIVQQGLWNSEKSAIVIYPQNLEETAIYLFIKDKLENFIAVDIKEIEQINLSKIGLSYRFDRVETKALEWIEHPTYYQIKVETKAWIKEKRFRRSEKLQIDKDGKVLWK